MKNKQKPFDVEEAKKEIAILLDKASPHQLWNILEFIKKYLQ